MKSITSGPAAWAQTACSPVLPRATFFQALATLLLPLLLPLTLAAHGQLTQVAIPPSYDQVWLDELGPFIQDDERTLYLSLGSSKLRQEFRRQYLVARDPTPSIFINPAKLELDHHLFTARKRGLPPTDLRSQLLLLHGPPQRLYRHGGCGVRLPEEKAAESQCVVASTFELYDFGANMPPGKPVLFVSTEDGCQLYGNTIRPPFHFRALSRVTCQKDGYHLLDGQLRSATRGALEWQDIEKTGLRLPAHPEWPASFSPDANDVNRSALALEVAEIQAPEEPPTNSSTWHLKAVLRVRPPRAWRDVGQPWHHLLVRTYAFSGSRLVGRFDQDGTFFPRHEAHGDSTPLALGLTLSLPPGDLTLVTHVEDEGAMLFETAAFAFNAEVGEPGGATAEALHRSSIFGDRSARAAMQEPALAIAPVPGPVRGVRPVSLAESTGIERVVYSLDGIDVARSDTAPFEALVDFGSLPRPMELAARGYRESTLVARQQLTVNQGLHHFDLDLSLQPGDDGVLVAGRTALPAGASFEGIELDVNGEPTRSFDTPTFTFRPELDLSRHETSFVRATARLADGRTVEDTVLLSELEHDEVDVELVEVFVKATRGRGTAVADLTAADLDIFELGVKQEIHSFERVQDVPIHVVLLLDTSHTMRDNLERLRETGVAFLRDLIQEDDQAAIITFNHRARVATPFTGDLETLEIASQSLRSWGGTALFDSAVMALYYLRGLEGKKALLLVSDGVEESSDLEFSQLIEYAERVDTSVYTLGVGTNDGFEQTTSSRARRHLKQLAARTGGVSFRIKRASELERAFQRIASDLRTQYIVTYQSQAGNGDREYRTIEVRPKKPGIKIEARPGYYP